MVLSVYQMATLTVWVQTVLRNKNLELRVLHMQTTSMLHDLFQQVTGHQVPSLSERNAQW